MIGPKDRFDKNLEDLKQSKTHHWWPLVMQYEWADKSGRVYRLSSEGDLSSYRVSRDAKYGSKKNFNTLNKELPRARFVFEGAFRDVDNDFKDLIANLRQDCGAMSGSLSSWLQRIGLVLKYGRKLEFLPRYGMLPDRIAKRVLLLALSLAIRSPRVRVKQDLLMRQIVSIEGNLPANFDTVDDYIDSAKKQSWHTNAELHNRFNRVRDIFSRDIDNIHEFFFLFIWCRKGRFLFGDGVYDTLSHKMSESMGSGSVLVSLAPDLSILVARSAGIRRPINFGTLVAPEYLIDSINDIYQILAEREVFFKNMPNIVDEYMYSKRRLYVPESLYGIKTLLHLTKPESIPSIWADSMSRQTR